MAIYKSSYNKKPEKEEKPKKQKQLKEKQPKLKTFKKKNSAIAIFVLSLIVFIACVLPSNFFKSFVLGLIGLSVYPLTVLGMLISGLIIAKKQYKAKKRYIVYLVCALCVIWFIFHLILTSKLSYDNYGTFLAQSYLAKTTAGGLIFSLISFPIVKLLTLVGTYIIFAILLAVFVGLIIDYLSVQSKMEELQNQTKLNLTNIEEFALDETPIETISEEEHLKNIAKRKLGMSKGESTIISSSMPRYDVDLQPAKPLNKREYILTPLTPVIPPESTQDVFFEQTNKKLNRPQVSNFGATSFAPPAIEEIKPTEEVFVQQPVLPVVLPEEKPVEEDEDSDLFVDETEDLSKYETAFETNMLDEEINAEEEFETSEKVNVEELEEEIEELQDLNENASPAGVETKVLNDVTINITENDFIDEYADNKDQEDLGSTVETEVVLPSVVDISKFNLPNVVKKSVEEEQPVEQIVQKMEVPPYVAPPVELLKYMDNPVRISDEELQDNIERLEQVLEDFKVPAKVNNVQVGPAVTRYELTMPRGISVNKIAQMSDDIAMTLASNGAIRVEAPIPGKTSVGIEVPNAQVSPVSLRELIDSEEFRVRGNPLSFVLGKDINGDIMFCNLDKMPHVLVAGSTGSGKSVCLNTMLLSMCYKAGPQDLRLILVDPKMVEFSTYNGLPHLLIPEVIIGKEMTINALDWSIKEMERRYALFAKNHVVNINEFNKLEIVKNKHVDKLPFIVIVVDELADLMLEAKREIEDRIAKLAAKARAAGIHLVLATQRPSVDVITGTVKANLPSRIAFALTNYMDSKTVLDGGGAEKLLGKGDMLFKPQDKPEPKRIQGAYVSNPEIAAVVQFIKDNNNPVYDDAAGRAIKNPHQNQQSVDNSNAKSMEFDPVLKDALRMFIQTKQASGSMITRRYSVGFNRAGRIMDQMERAGFIGPPEGSKPRQVLITMDEYLAIFGEDE